MDDRLDLIVYWVSEVFQLIIVIKSQYYYYQLYMSHEDTRSLTQPRSIHSRVNSECS